MTDRIKLAVTNRVTELINRVSNPISVDFRDRERAWQECLGLVQKLSTDQRLSGSHQFIVSECSRLTDVMNEQILKDSRLCIFVATFQLLVGIVDMLILLKIPNSFSHFSHVIPATIKVAGNTKNDTLKVPAIECLRQIVDLLTPSPVGRNTLCRLLLNGWDDASTVVASMNATSYALDSWREKMPLIDELARAMVIGCSKGAEPVRIISRECLAKYSALFPDLVNHGSELLAFKVVTLERMRSIEHLPLGLADVATILLNRIRRRDGIAGTSALTGAGM
jgi:hypothetical protein